MIINEITQGMGGAGISLLLPGPSPVLRTVRLAETEWPRVKGELLTTLATHDEWSAGKAKIEIFLHEGMLDEAIAIVDNFRYCDDRIIHLGDGSYRSPPS